MPSPFRSLQHLASAVSSCAACTRLWRSLLLGLIVAVSYLALAPIPPPSVDLGWDKLNHVAAFAALTISALLGFPASRINQGKLLFLLLAYGGLIEVLQLFVPGRACEWTDLIADTLGIAGGALIAGLLARWATSKRTR